MLRDPFLQQLLSLSADDVVGFFAILKQHQAGDGLNAEALGGVTGLLAVSPDAARFQLARRSGHCWNQNTGAGAAMGHAGMSALQISQWLGSSEDICRRHHIAPIGARPWPLRYC